MWLGKLVDIHQQLIEVALQIQGHYFIKSRIEVLYVSKSRDFIIPGLNMVEELAVDGRNQLTHRNYKRKVDLLNQWEGDAQDSIRKRADEVSELVFSVHIFERPLTSNAESGQTSPRNVSYCRQTCWKSAYNASTAV
jgi:hypothetical protein